MHSSTGAAFSASGGLLNGNVNGNASANNVHHLLTNAGAPLMFDDAAGPGVHGEVEVGGGSSVQHVNGNGNSNGLASGAMPPAKKRRLPDSVPNHVGAAAQRAAAGAEVDAAENGDSGLGIGTDQNGTPTSQHSSVGAASIAMQLQLPGSFRPIPD